MFAASKTGGVVASSGDPYWTSVSLLTNFENNLTFQDGSTNNIALTRNGVVNPSLATPFTGGVGGSEYFNGSTGYVSGTTSTAAEFGTGDFTVEAFVYLTAAATYAFLFGSSGLNMYFGIAVYGVAPLYRLTAYDGTTVLEQTAGTSFTLNAWNHVAWVRSGTTFTAYLNGASVYSTTNSKNITGTTGFQVGHSPNYVPYYCAGNISNFRIVKGTAVYTSAFTPPTAPLTAITNTSLLITGTGQGMFDNSTFVDQGPSALTVTATGAPVYSGLSPFGNTYAGSVLFNGTSQYLSTPDSTAFTLGSGNFTVEAWIYNGTTGARQIICGQIDSGGTIASLSFYLEKTAANKFLAGVASGGTSYTATSTADLPLNQWTHLAFVRNGNTGTLYINGSADGTVNLTGVTVNDSANAFSIGRLGEFASLYFPGYVSNLRITKGTAVYTANFTPPTTPLTAITNTSLLVRGDTGAFYDLSNSGLALTANGATAKISVAASKFGTLSTVYDGTQSSAINVAISALLNMPGDFTLEAWSNVPTATVQTAYPEIYNGPAASFTTVSSGYASNNNFTAFSTTPSFTIASGIAAKDSTWHFLALVRSGSTITFYVDGVNKGTATTSTAVDLGSSAAARIGASTNGAADGPFNGYIDSIRITKGVARYTANFTPPTVTFPLGP